jgi:hypothetical protein
VLALLRPFEDGTMTFCQDGAIGFMGQFDMIIRLPGEAVIKSFFRFREIILIGFLDQVQGLLQQGWGYLVFKVEECNFHFTETGGF